MLKILKRIVIAVLTAGLLVAVLFVLNGTLLAKGEKALGGTIEGTASRPVDDTREITVMSYNLAKCWAVSGRNFAAVEDVQKCLDGMAEMIRAEDPDLVFLSEAVFTCGPCPVNQVTYLGKATGLHGYACGECYNIGLPGYNVSGGTAILARSVITPVQNISLAGRKPFYQTKNSRRALFGQIKVQGEALLLGSLHNDSFNPEKNRVQIGQILEFVGDQPAILAGDFNAKPEWDSIQAIKNSGDYTGAFDGPHTFPTDPNPKNPRKIDFIFAPKDWALVEERVIQTTLSDHYPIVAVFRLP